LDAVTEIHEDQLVDVAADLLDSAVDGVSRVEGSGNNRLYRCRLSDGADVALKVYPFDINDGRDRLGREYAGLQFLADRGVDCVPKPFACDRLRQVAAYQWIDGETPATCNVKDVDQALALAGRLRELSADAAAAALPEATEACLSINELGRQIHRRLERLRQVERADLQVLLQDELIEEADRVWGDAMHGAEICGFDPDAEIAADMRTLSPSDFGFHNALRRADGSIVFVDFEYFGWDDPVKLTADFLLHPGMQLGEGELAAFINGARRRFAADPAFGTRLRLLFPLYAVRWSLIMLNEFLPERWARRRFAGASAGLEQVLRTQLEKARAMLRRANDVNGGWFNEA
jgi:hypothetical protein